MAVVSKFNVLKTDGEYEARDLAAKGINVTINYDSSGNILTDDDIAATTTKSASQTLKDLMTSINKLNSDKAPNSHRSSSTTYGAADTTYYGHVKVGSNITVSGGVISLSKANVIAALGYTPPTTDTTYTEATSSTSGLMSTEDKIKLNGIAANANNYVHPTSSGNKHIPAGGASGQFLGWYSEGTSVWVDNPATQVQTDLATETTRATAAESALQTKITELEEKIANLYTTVHTWIEETD